MKSYCANCKNETNHNVIFSKDIRVSDETGWWDDTSYQVVECMGCEEVSFRKLYNDISMESHYDDLDTTMQELYPLRGPSNLEKKFQRRIPTEIKVVYNEVIDSYNSNLVLLCGIGIRGVIEAICKEKGIVSGSVPDGKGGSRISKQLDGKIYGLAEKGFITSENANTLHELRFMGNTAVHELVPPSKPELALAIEIAELTIENLYIISYKRRLLESTRLSKKKTS